MIRIDSDSLTCTCSACPTQYEGQTLDGKTVYIRFRHGWLSLGVGDTLDEAVLDGGTFGAAVSDDLDGTMSLADIKRHLDGTATFEATGIQ